MGRPPLNPRGGDAVRIETRIEDGDHDRLLNLAERRGIKPPVLVRELLRLALDQFEDSLADTGPLASG